MITNIKIDHLHTLHTFHITITGNINTGIIRIKNNKYKSKPEKYKNNSSIYL